MPKTPIPAIPPSAITPQTIYLRAARAAGRGGGVGLAGTLAGEARAAALSAAKSPLSTDEPATPLADITSYNNFYEFGTGKEDPAANAHTLTTSPWTVKVDGLVANPGRLCARGHPQGRLRSRSASTGCAASRAGRW